MNKFLYALTAGAAALVLASGSALAADQTRPNEEPQPRAAENQPGDAATVTTGNEQAKPDQEYTAALKKCDSMKESNKQACIEAAQKKHGHM